MDELKIKLRQAAASASASASSAASTVKAPEKSEDELLEEAYLALKKTHSRADSLIPPFFDRLPADDDLLGQKLREEARAEFLQRRSRALLDNEELKRLWTLLDSHAEATSSPPSSSSSSSGQQHQGGGGESEQVIDYEAFKAVRGKAGDKCEPFFTAAVFAKLQHGDPKGRISVMALFNYVMRKVWLHQTRIGLSLYDVTGQGYALLVLSML